MSPHPTSHTHLSSIHPPHLRCQIQPHPALAHTIHTFGEVSGGGGFTEGAYRRVREMVDAEYGFEVAVEGESQALANAHTTGAASSRNSGVLGE